MKYSVITLALLGSIPQSHATEDVNSSKDKEVISIVGNSPLQQATDTVQLIGQTQTLTSEDLGMTPNRSLAEILRAQFTSVNINHVQNNPFQPDVQYRGFTASPLLGLPQGVSIYLNGTRFNEPFGDTVNWDLIPLEALDNAVLFSTSNPVFGQNTLGGALGLNTKTGYTFTNTQLDASIGEYGRQELTVQSGIDNDDWAAYVLASHYEEDGWRDYSPSEVTQLLGTLSKKIGQHQIDLTYLNVNSELLGNGAIPIDLQDFAGAGAVYTHPDKTSNALDFASLNGTFILAENTSLQANIFLRENTTDSINGDDSDFGPCFLRDNVITLCELDDDDDDNLGHTDDDEGEIPFADGDEIEAVDFIGYDGLALSEISSIAADELDGTYNTGSAENQSYGTTMQLNHLAKLAGIEHSLVFGLSYQKADISYLADSAFGILENDTADDSRTVTPFDLLNAEARVRLDVTTTHKSVYFSDIVAISPNLSINVAARFNQDHVLMNDLIDDGEGSLDGDHRFSQFNPALGFSYLMSDSSELNLSIAQSSRVPSPAELSCADENDPCRLPNGFVADPPLDQVVTRTIEASYKYVINNYSSSITVYHSISEDDIIFQQAGSTSSRGYFVNIDKTQRQGIELAAQWQNNHWHVGGSYTHLNATFEAPFVSFSPMNPMGPNRQVSPGATIPGQPKQQLKSQIEYKGRDNLIIGAELLAASSQYYRGDEANENAQISGYGLLNLYGVYDVNKHMSLSFRVDNALDKSFYTFGTYGEADEVLEDIYPEIDDPEFIGPAHPRMVSVGISYQF